MPNKVITQRPAKAKQAVRTPPLDVPPAVSPILEIVMAGKVLASNLPLQDVIDALAVGKARELFRVDEVAYLEDYIKTYQSAKDVHPVPSVGIDEDAPPAATYDLDNAPKNAPVPAEVAKVIETVTAREPLPSSLTSSALEKALEYMGQRADLFGEEIVIVTEELKNRKAVAEGRAAPGARKMTPAPKPPAKGKGKAAAKAEGNGAAARGAPKREAAPKAPAGPPTRAPAGYWIEPSKNKDRAGKFDLFGPDKNYGPEWLIGSYADKPAAIAAALEHKAKRAAK